MDAAQVTAQFAALNAQEVNQQQQLAALQAQLAASADQTAARAEAMDILRQESSHAVQDLRRLLAEARAGSAHQGQKPREMNFINSKSFEGGQFS